MGGMWRRDKSMEPASPSLGDPVGVDGEWTVWNGGPEIWLDTSGRQGIGQKKRPAEMLSRPSGKEYTVIELAGGHRPPV